MTRYEAVVRSALSHETRTSLILRLTAPDHTFSEGQRVDVLVDEEPVTDTVLLDGEEAT